VEKADPLHHNKVLTKHKLLSSVHSHAINIMFTFVRYINNGHKLQLTLLVSFFYVLLTVHLSIFISVINQLDAQNFCFTISLFHVSTCFEHMCSKHVET